MSDEHIFRARFRFKVRADPDGECWIAADPMDRDVLDRGILGFDLPPGTKLDTADQIAQFLNEIITQIFMIRPKF